MSFFSDLKAERLIADIRGIGDPAHPEAQKAFQKLARIGPGAIPKILDALAVADKKEAASYVEILTQLVDNKTFPILVQGLTDGSPRTIAAVSWALTASHNYSPALLIDLLAREDISKPAVLEIIAAHKQRFTVRDLLQHAYSQEANEKAALFRIIGDLADTQSIPELTSRIEGKDSIARMHIINILSRFNRPEVSAAIQTQLKDPNKLIRQAALNALTKMDGPIAVGPVTQLLRDPDLETANRAIDVVVRAKDPDTMKYLIEVLKDENEYARRAAVEVLNHLGTAR
ncbi:MAG TPA: HEAT repeat domain-containing protein, partial [Steroidobacteraceae bacterium]|nr:HEAT repeat domain-containing protein [Steroidobacteraceae bacterium]